MRVWEPRITRISRIVKAFRDDLYSSGRLRVRLRNSRIIRAHSRNSWFHLAFKGNLWQAADRPKLALIHQYIEGDLVQKS
jgi:hypothetical protein